MESEAGAHGQKKMRREGGERGGDIKRRAQIRCQRIPNSPFAPFEPPSADRAFGQFEITLSPSRCVQSKLQFKSSCQTLFSRSLLFPLSRYHPRSFLAPGVLFRHPELEIPKIVLHRPPTNFAMPGVCVRSTLSFKCVHCSSVFVHCVCVVIVRTSERASERMSKLLHSWIEGADRRTLRLAVTSRPHYWRIPLHDRLLRGERGASRG